MKYSATPERGLPELLELDSEGRILFLKWAGKERLSKREDEFVGRNFFSDVATFENAAELREYFDRFDQDRSHTNTFAFNCKFQNGSERVTILLARLREKKSPKNPESVLMYIKAGTPGI